MRILNKKKDDKKGIIEKLKERFSKKGKGQYEKQDAKVEVKDKDFSVEKEPIYHKSKMEDKSRQPKFRKKPAKDDIKNVRSNAHKTASKAGTPDDDLMKEYPPDNTKIKMSKAKKKKISALVIRKNLKKKK